MQKLAQNSKSFEKPEKLASKMVEHGPRRAAASRIDGMYISDERIRAFENLAILIETALLSAAQVAGCQAVPLAAITADHTLEV